MSHNSHLFVQAKTSLIAKEAIDSIQILSTMVLERKQLIYFVRHAEATHNIEERKAVQAAKDRGVTDKEELEKARRSVLDFEELRDAPLSAGGSAQVRKTSNTLNLLHSTGSKKYPAPKLVLVSPLRRTLMTATQLFLSDADDKTNPPKFVALEALREKRTGFAADERRSVDILEKEFPHVDFSDLRRMAAEGLEVPFGEDNAAVRKRGRAFMEGQFTQFHEESIAVVTHKAWLREMRQTIKEKLDDGLLQVDFDFEQWHQTLYKNAEVRIAQFSWIENRLSSIVSKSLENSLRSVTEDAVHRLLEKQKTQYYGAGKIGGLVYQPKPSISAVVNLPHVHSINI